LEKPCRAATFPGRRVSEPLGLNSASSPIVGVRCRSLPSAMRPFQKQTSLALRFGQSDVRAGRNAHYNRPRPYHRLPRTSGLVVAAASVLRLLSGKGPFTLSRTISCSCWQLTRDGRTGELSSVGGAGARRSRCFRHPTCEPLESQPVVGGPYAAGWHGGGRVNRPADEEGFSKTSTARRRFAANRGWNVDTRRWAGVPFYLSHRTRLGRRVTEIALIR